MVRPIGCGRSLSLGAGCNCVYGLSSAAKTDPIGLKPNPNRLSELGGKVNLLPNKKRQFIQTLSLGGHFRANKQKPIHLALSNL